MVGGNQACAAVGEMTTNSGILGPETSVLPHCNTNNPGTNYITPQQHGDQMRSLPGLVKNSQHEQPSLREDFICLALVFVLPSESFHVFLLKNAFLFREATLYKCLH